MSLEVYPLGLSIIVGGQFGSEGKGKVSHWYANKVKASAVIRVGGINSGHTVVDALGRIHIFRVLPTVAIDNNKVCVLPAGSYIDVELLFKEIRQSGINPSLIRIDPKAAIITSEHIAYEKDSGLSSFIGSTASGTGAAVSMRVNRNTSMLFAKDIPTLAPFICDVTAYLRNELDNGNEIVIEGTQGFGLSNLHTPYYPYATSRDTSAAGFLSEVGLSPMDVTNIIMVIRTFPIRVAGNSGPLPYETSWEDITTISNSAIPLCEYTSVTKKLRRVAHFDPKIVTEAIAVNKPTMIVLNHLDYIGENGSCSIGSNRRACISKIQSQIGQKIDYVGLSNKDIVLCNII